MATMCFFFFSKWKKCLAVVRHFFFFLHGAESLKQTLKQYIYIYIIKKKLFSIIYRRKGFRPLFYTSVHCVLIHVDSKNLTKWFHNIICGMCNVDTIMLLIGTQNFQFSIYMFVINLIRKHSNCIFHVFVYLD